MLITCMTINRSKEQAIEAKKKSAKKLSSSTDGSSGSATKKSSKEASSVKKSSSTDTPDGNLSANKKEGITVLPSIDKIMSIARECQIRVDDPETRDKVIAAGFKAMKENEAKRRADNDQFVKVTFEPVSDTKNKLKQGKKNKKIKEHKKEHPKARSEPPSKAVPKPASKAHSQPSSKAVPEHPSKAHSQPPSKAVPEPPSKACGEDVANVQQEISSLVDSSKVNVKEKPVKNNIENSSKNVHVTDGIDSGKQDKSQNLDDVDKTDVLPPVPFQPDNMYPTSTPEAATPTSINAGLDSLEKEPVKLKSESDIKQKEKMLSAMKDANTKPKVSASKSKSEEMSPALVERRKIIRAEMLAEARVKMALSMKDSTDAMLMSHVFNPDLKDCCDELVESLRYSVNRSRCVIDRELFDPTLLSVEDYRTVIFEEIKAQQKSGLPKRKIRVIKPEVCVSLGIYLVTVWIPCFPDDYG